MNTNLKRTGPPGTWTKGNTISVPLPVPSGWFVKGPHGLGRKPDWIRVYAECIVPESDYKIGDRIHLSDSCLGDDNNASYYGHQAWGDNVNIGWSVYNPPIMMFKGTGSMGVSGALSANSWKIIIVPWKIN